MWSSCIKFIIFVQSASFWYICRYWIKRDFATFNHMSSCWEINVSIFLFISGNVISATEDIICSSPVAPVVSKMVASIGCCWGPPDFFAFEFRSLFLPGYGAILQYQNPPLLLTYSPLAFHHRNGIFAWLHSLNPHCLKCIDVKANRKKRLIQTLVKCNILTACFCKWPWNR